MEGAVGEEDWESRHQNGAGLPDKRDNVDVDNAHGAQSHSNTYIVTTILTQGSNSSVMEEEARFGHQEKERVASTIDFPAVLNGPTFKEPSKRKISGNDDGSTTTDSSYISNFITVDASEVAKKKRILEKLVYVIVMVTIIILAYGLLMLHWLLPYYYAVSAPILILIRIVMYWKFKWQLFLIDFCYFGNILCYIYLWAFPQNQVVFAIIFGLSNGPLAWAVALFRNSLVLHDIDKMTSCYIHILPAFLTYSIRWYSTSISLHWYQPFAVTFPEDLPFMALWLVGIPFGVFVTHSLFYIILVDVILRPGDEYLNSYRYLSTKSVYEKFFGCCGNRCKYLMYYIYLWLYCCVALLSAVLLYKYFIAHAVFMAIICLVATWNGASYYVDIYGTTRTKIPPQEITVT